MHHHGFGQRAVSWHLALLGDALRPVSLDEPFSNRILANTHEAPDGSFSGASTLTSRNQRKKQGLHDAGS